MSVASLCNVEWDHTIEREREVIGILFYGRMNQYLRISLLIFVIGLVLGAVFAKPLQTALSPLMTDLKTLALGMKHETFGAMMMTLFLHNLRTSVFMMVGGILFGIFPALFVLVNGALVGYVIAITYQTTHVNPFLLFAAGILPHGIFEIPAYLLASAFGIRAGVVLIRTMGRHLEHDNWRKLGKDMVPTLVIVVVLLFVAANIETGITPLLLRMVYHHA